MRLAGLGLAFALIALAAPRARAQCGETPSSCASCHGAPPDAPWHGDHAFADLCSRCHGGDPLAPDADGAHAGLVAPLGDPRTTCATCHAADLDARVAAYDGVTPTTTPPPATTAAPPPRPATADAIAAIVAVVLGGGGLAIVVRGERRRRGVARPKRRTIRALLALPSWSPYLAGAGLGVVVTIAMAIFGRRLSGAGAYQSLSGYVGRALAPNDVYWTSIVTTGVTWDVWLAIGTLAGAFASALAGRQVHLRTMPDEGWVEIFGPRVWVRWLIVFLGTALLPIAAGLAGGCTAGLAISGGAVLAPAAFVFIAMMFAGGIAVVRLLDLRRSR